MSDSFSHGHLHHLKDAELLTRSRRGDGLAFAELYERHHVAVRRAALRYANATLAADLVAEAFARVFALIRQGGGPEFAFRPYVVTAVRNAFVSHVRVDSRVLWVDDPSTLGTVPFVSDGAGERAESDALVRAFRSLPDRWQKVLWHRVVEGESTSEVAGLLDLSANAVAALTFRAREGLRRALLT
jgi:RNA polymerase sigma factor (sigma-70 family)